MPENEALAILRSTSNPVMRKVQRNEFSPAPDRSPEADRKIKEASSEFESFFIYYLLKEMRATVPKCGFISGGKAEAFYTSLLDDQLSRDLSRTGGIGLSALLSNHFKGNHIRSSAIDERQKQEK